ncbi:Cro/CI family transcriptional regulator [Stenotrophomonas sp. GD03819]|uniref:Cro/CI family transcriptional regulator n=1 Tax=Stenotrophomonas sp. GD03819 TaxID=2975384 RepID=UPI00244D162C|nr:Cro/CI family transcriptional regulator [Stenotrophomonas sp. GD03819]MDH1791296.1 Cro/CI family transcriptional regulator [Stenotrophomonas sp. GD03819]
MPRITKEEAIAAYDGNAAALARALGITPSAVYQWPAGQIDDLWALKLRFVLMPAHFQALERPPENDPDADRIVPVDAV